jgi:hypothetical protein
MERYIPVETPGGTIWVEVDGDIDPRGLTLTASSDKAFKTFKEAAQALKGNAQFLLDMLEDLSPEEMEIEFGIKVGAEAGTPFFGLAKTSGEANYTITLKWVADESKIKK